MHLDPAHLRPSARPAGVRTRPGLLGAESRAPPVPGTTLLPALRSPDSRPSRVFSTESVQQQSCHKPRRPVLSANGRAGGTPRHTSSGGRGSLGPNGEAEGQTRQQQRAGGKDGWGTGRSRVRTKRVQPPTGITGWALGEGLTLGSPAQGEDRAGLIQSSEQQKRQGWQQTLPQSLRAGPSPELHTTPLSTPLSQARRLRPGRLAG